MKQVIFGTIFIVSLFFTFYGVIKNKKSAKKLGYGGIIFVVLAMISDYIYYLDI